MNEAWEGRCISEGLLCLCRSSVMLSAGWRSNSAMSTSDSDCSIDWLASDEDDYDGLKTLSPQQAEEPPEPPSSPSSSTSSVRESPTSCFHCGATQRRKRRSDRREVDADSPSAPQTPAVSPVQGFTSVYTPQTLSGESRHHSTRKRAYGAGPGVLCENPPADTENELFSQKVRSLCCRVVLFVRRAHGDAGRRDL